MAALIHVAAPLSWIRLGCCRKQEICNHVFMRILFCSNTGGKSGFNGGEIFGISVWLRGEEKNRREIINNHFIVWYMRKDFCEGIMLIFILL